jgi:hypothetical protein
MGMAMYRVGGMSLTMGDVLRGRTALLKQNSAEEVDGQLLANGNSMSITCMMLMLQIAHAAGVLCLFYIMMTGFYRNR